MTSTPPPAASFLQKHTHHSDESETELSSSVRSGVSNLIDGLVNGATTPADDDATPLKHRNSSSKSYDQRKPKILPDEDAVTVPYRGFGKMPSFKDNENGHPDNIKPFEMLRYRLRGFFSPRATDMQQLLVKLDNQFSKLILDHEMYKLERDGSVWDQHTKGSDDNDNKKDPNHPLNNPNIITEVHFVGRKAIDLHIIELSTFIMSHDTFGSITELWLNDNLISDDGAASIASFLQLPHCALVELWLGSNQIGPAGTTLISASLSDNENSKLKCLGLYKNPIGNGGASTLAQMLRKNHKLTTVDVHGCGSRSGKGGQEVLEGYGCKVVVGPDGTEYVARVVANTEEQDGVVTDQRLLDSIQTFVAFNRISPTREQAIRGMMASNKHIEDGGATKGKKEGDNTTEHKSNVSTFLSELCNKPANEQLTDAEKRTWKDCEWERLYLEMERARVAKAAMAKKVVADAEASLVKVQENDSDLALVDEEEGNINPLVEKDNDDVAVAEEEDMIGDSLDDEVVRTDRRSWHDLKMGITGSTKAQPRERKAPPPVNEHSLYVISDVEKETEEEGDKLNTSVETVEGADNPSPESELV